MTNVTRPGKRKPVSPKKRFVDAVRDDMAVVDVTEEDADDRTEWKWTICSGDPWREKPKEEEEELAEHVNLPSKPIEASAMTWNCKENEGDDYRRHRRGDSGWEGYRGSNEIRFLWSADYQGRTMREGSAKKNSYGKSRNGRTNITMEGQRSNDGDEGETSECFGVPDCCLQSETWTIRKHERRKIDAFELWCWRRVLRVSWMERKTNIWIIENIKPESTLESSVPKAVVYRARLGQSENMREGRSTLSSCGVGEEY